MTSIGSRSAAVALGLLVDRVVGEPPAHLHPVAAFGQLMTRFESVRWRDDRVAGAEYGAVGVATAALVGTLARSTAAAVAVSTAGRELRSVAADVGDRLDADDLDGARAALPSLVGRDPSELDTSDISAAVVESLAENTVDAVVASAFWGAVAGPRGALVHRAVNTMDAMVGHRSERYGRYGTATARLDDAANYLPARLFAGLVIAARPDRASAIVEAIRRDAPAHPSPNAGVAEAAVAGALGIELGGPLRYGGRHEDRPRLGRGPRPEPRHVREAIALVDRVELLLGGLLAAIALVGYARARR
ncbi:MAG: adenosylcobinamide-phosphate synthase CbiB [Actinomycetota bacterium]